MISSLLWLQFYPVNSKHGLYNYEDIFFLEIHIIPLKLFYMNVINYDSVLLV